VVPFWENHCLDKENGGYFTFLDRDGSVYDTEKWKTFFHLPRHLLMNINLMKKMQ